MADKAEALLIVLLDGVSAVPCNENLLDELCDALQEGKEKGREKEHRTKREPIPAQRSVLSLVSHTQEFPQPNLCNCFTCHTKCASALLAVQKCQAAIEEAHCCNEHACMIAAAGSQRRALQQNYIWSYEQSTGKACDCASHNLNSVQPLLVSGLQRMYEPGRVFCIRFLWQIQPLLNELGRL